MEAPYRAASPPRDAAAEELEIQDFANRMHAGRRVWASEHLGLAILGSLMGATIVVMSVVFRPASTAGANLLLATPGLIWLALAATSFAAWLRHKAGCAKR